MLGSNVKRRWFLGNGPQLTKHVQVCSSPVLHLSPFSFSRANPRKLAFLGERLVMSAGRLKQAKFHLQLGSPVTARIGAPGPQWLFPVSHLHRQGDEALCNISLAEFMEDNSSPFWFLSLLTWQIRHVALFVCVDEGGAPGKSNNWWLSKLIWWSQYQSLYVCALSVRSCKNNLKSFVPSVTAVTEMIFASFSLPVLFALLVWDCLLHIAFSWWSGYISTVCFSGLRHSL